MFILERIIDLIAPATCMGCGAEGSPLCQWCKPDCALPLPSRCYMCRALTIDFAVCSSCKRKSSLRHAWVATEYNGVAKKLLSAYKFERLRVASVPIAECMADVLPYLPRDTRVVPVPTATSRVRIRGYDHTRLLAREISRLVGLQNSSVLGRLGQTRQVGAHRKQRLIQLESAFYVRDRDVVEGKNILLVDDIVTSGGTIEMAAKTLKKAGAKSVSALLFAQKS